MSTTPVIPGLPAGIEVVRFGTCEPEEFELHGDHVCKGPRGYSQVVVKPAEGWRFEYDIYTNNYRPVKRLAVPRTFAVYLTAETEAHAAYITEQIRKNAESIGVKVGDVVEITVAPPKEQVVAA